MAVFITEWTFWLLNSGIYTLNLTFVISACFFSFLRHQKSYLKYWKCSEKIFPISFPKPYFGQVGWVLQNILYLMKLHILREWHSAKDLGSSFNRSSENHRRAELGKMPSVENPVDFCFFHGIHLDSVRKMELTLYPSLGVWFTSTQPLQMSLEPCGFKSVQQDADRPGPCPGKHLNTCLTETMPLVPSRDAQRRRLNGTFLQRLVPGSTSGEHIQPRELLHSVQVGLQCRLGWGCL